MIDELKDFRYYADKAESLIKGINASARPNEVAAWAAAAQAYAELAKAAPKAEPAQRFIFMTDAEAEMFRAMKGDQ